MNNTFKVGDTVRLKNGTAPMIVRQLDGDYI